MLRTVRTVIVDEIHALAGNKRGAHLALSLERLEALCDRAADARRHLGDDEADRRADTAFLTGVTDAPLHGHRRRPRARARSRRSSCRGSPLEAIMADEVWVEEYDRLAELIRAHRTTLVFVNTRRLAERAARHLAERLGEDAVTSHHGSLAKEHRLQRRGAAQGRAAQGARGDRVARARHRHRRRGSRLPARLAARDRGVPAARRPLGPRARAVAEGPAVSAVARRPRRVHGAARRASGAASSTRSSRGPRRSTCSRSRSSPRSACRNGGSTICTRASRARRPTATCRATSSSASRAWSRTASRRIAAGAARICTSIA